MNDESLAPINMHMHSHFSFNAEARSPTALVAEAERRGLYAIGVLDFDVLDGLEETYAAAERLGLRAAVGIETRTFLDDYAGVETNSPGEPGIYYQVAMGFGRVPGEETEAGKTLAKLRALAQERNREMADRINAAFPEIAIHFDTDVLPLTPSGNPTERHMVTAYVQKVREFTEDDEDEECEIWVGILRRSKGEVAALLTDEKAFLNAIRARLMKKGGVGYARPYARNFPSNREVVGMILEAGAIPLVGWLDGLSDGERDTEAYLDAMRARGAAGVNIVPHRNWNVADPELRKTKVAKLHEVVRAAEAREMPINVGTELNSYGLPFVDNFEAPEMRPLWPAFFRGAQIMIGHARLARYAGFSYCGPEAEAEFGRGLDGKNGVFRDVGALPPLTPGASKGLLAMGQEKAFAAIRDSAKAGTWEPTVL